MIVPRPKKIWIDLDNSPHVPFFLPIIEELEKRGYHIILTARNTYQVSELLDFHGLSSKVIIGGQHWGKSRILKIIGTCLRALQLLPVLVTQKPDLAVSHGSRAQILSSYITRVPCIVIFDYEFTSSTGGVQPDWAFAPDLIPESVAAGMRSQFMRYPGLKEDVYIHRLRPDPSVKAHLGLSDTDLVVTVRPPATEAHYHNPEADVLLDGVLTLLTEQPDVRVILVPRNENQAKLLRMQWDKWIERRKIIIPEHAVDGLNLIWFSDLVVSGGGTMNREAAALGVPVYSIFRGRIGAVDQYLADQGRLTLIRNLDDIQTKIVIKRRTQHQLDPNKPRSALNCIVNAIISIVEHRCLPTHR
ncbi:MAG: DUF354 domain-containing protein [Nitrospiraceae bacterium]